MFWRAATPYFAVLLLTELLVKPFLSTSILNTKFKRTKICPAAAKLHQIRLRSKLECAGACSAQYRCNAFHFDRNSRLCYIGDACSEEQQWHAGTCDSYVYNPDKFTIAASDSKSAVFKELHMNLFYRLKNKGLVNEVDPRQFCLKAHDVEIRDDGAEFKGRPTSFLSTETPGFEQFLDYGKSYSFYILVRHVMDCEYQYYHSFWSCGSSPKRSNAFAKRSNFVYGYSYWTQGGYGRFLAESDTFLPATTEPALLSVGCAYNRTAYQHFYFNGSVYNQFRNAYPMEPGVSVGRSSFGCLKLGYSPDASLSLKGSLYCYGMSSKILGLEEFKQLEALCNTK